MIELVKFMITELVDHKEDVSVGYGDDDETIYVKVNKADMGKVIGRDGRIAKAVRTIAKAAGNKEGKKCSVVILEADEQ